MECEGRVDGVDLELYTHEKGRLYYGCLWGESGNPDSLAFEKRCVDRKSKRAFAYTREAGLRL